MFAACIDRESSMHVTLEQALRAVPGRWTFTASIDEQGCLVAELHPVGQAAHKITRLVLADVLVDLARPAVAQELRRDP